MLIRQARTRPNEADRTEDCIHCGATEMIVPPIEEQMQEILQEMAGRPPRLKGRW
jgi:hypothetical protein